jgi:hypothetical protein
VFGLAIIMASVVAGRNFLVAGILVRLEADLALAAGMNIPIGDARQRWNKWWNLGT